MRIAVASGKGGTGKTLLSTNLAWLLARNGREVVYVDADVEEPNGHLFLHPELSLNRRFGVPVPALKAETCSGCGACQRFCAYNAIIALQDGVLLFPELCHSCGGCLLACPEDALHEIARETGTITIGRSPQDPGISFRSATLDVGEAMATPLIEGLLEELPPAGLIVIDAPPGTSCNTMAAVKHADSVLLVTEPTPFGLHDLKLAVEMTRALERPISAVINRADLGDDRVRVFLKHEQIPIVAEIPFIGALARAYARGEIAARSVPGFYQLVERIADVLLVQEGAP